MSKFFGYWNDIVYNGTLLSNYEEVLNEAYEGTTNSAWEYLHGFCTHFAYQLAKKYSLPIVAFKDVEGRLLHAFCEYIDDDRQQWLLDIRGATTEFDFFFGEFDIDWEDDDWFSYRRFGVDELEDFYKQYVGDDGNPVNDEILRDAEAFVEVIFEDY